jgi:hypothetical protein
MAMSMCSYKEVLSFESSSTKLITYINVTAWFGLVWLMFAGALTNTAFGLQTTSFGNRHVQMNEHHQ